MTVNFVNSLFTNKIFSCLNNNFLALVFAPCGCPYNNAVAEAMFKVLKAEFANGAYFTSLEQLAFELEDYVHWFNNVLLHESLDYLTPVEFKAAILIKIAQLVLTYQNQLLR